MILQIDILKHSDLDYLDLQYMFFGRRQISHHSV